MWIKNILIWIIIFESYDVSINVLENNTLEITEKISAYFNVGKHGIFRKIPTTNSVERADGSKGVTNAKVKNLSVSDNYDSYTEGNYYVVEIGDEDRTVLGPHDYLISYSYVMGKDIGKALMSFISTSSAMNGILILIM